MATHHNTIDTPQIVSLEEAKRLYSAQPQPDNAIVTQAGLFAVSIGEPKRHSNAPKCVRVGDPIKLVALISRPNGSFDCVSVFDSPLTGMKVCILPVEDLYAGHAVQHLVSQGYGLVRKAGANELFRAMFDCVRSGLPVFHEAGRQGLQPDGAYLVDSTVIGRPSSSYRLDPSRYVQAGISGKLPDWREQISMAFAESKYLVFAISAAFAGFLKTRLGKPGAMFNFYGQTSRGKTLLLQAAASALGHHSKIVSNWHMTSAGFEEHLVKWSGFTTIIDEMRAGFDKIEDMNIVFFISQEQTKRKARGHGGGEKIEVFILSTNELRRGDLRPGEPKNGDHVRCLAIPVPDHDTGVFTSAMDGTESRSMARRLEDACATHYGTAFPAFVSAFMAAGLTNIELEARLSEIAARLRQPGDDNIKSRGVDAFAIVALAGELATEFGVTGWNMGRATEAANEMAEAWRKGKERTVGSSLRASLFNSSSDSPSDKMDSLIERAIKEGPAVDDAELAIERLVRELCRVRPLSIEEVRQSPTTPDPQNPDCPVFTFSHRGTDCLCFGEWFLREQTGASVRRRVLNRLRESGEIVTNGHDSFQLAVKIGQRVLNFYAIKCEAVKVRAFSNSNPSSGQAA